MSRLSFRVTLSVWLVLFLTAWNGVRLWTAIAWRDVLIEFGSRPSPTISAVSGAFWFIVGILLVWSIVWEKAWAGKMLVGAAAGYTVWYWTERLIWQSPRPNWPFAVILNLIVMVFILYVKRAMMREAHERESENPTLE